MQSFDLEEPLHVVFRKHLFFDGFVIHPYKSRIWRGIRFRPWFCFKNYFDKNVFLLYFLGPWRLKFLLKYMFDI